VLSYKDAQFTNVKLSIKYDGCLSHVAITVAAALEVQPDKKK